MKINWFGTASIVIRSNNQSLLFDPFIPLKGSEHSVDISAYDGFSSCLVTHGHFDHIANLPEISKRNPKMKIYCTKTPYATLLKKGVLESALVPITYDEELIIGDFKIKTYHGKHAVLPKASFSKFKEILSRGNLGNLPHALIENNICKENEETVYYEVEAEGKRVAIMGSLNLRENIDYPTQPDVLIMPYNGWNDNFRPAVEVAERIKPKRILLDHYDDTFPPITGPIDLLPIQRKYVGFIQKLTIDNAYLL